MKCQWTCVIFSINLEVLPQYVLCEPYCFLSDFLNNNEYSSQINILGCIVNTGTHLQRCFLVPMLTLVQHQKPRNRTMKQLKKVAWSGESRVSFPSYGQLCACETLSGKLMAPRCFLEISGGISVMLWETFYWRTMQKLFRNVLGITTKNPWCFPEKQAELYRGSTSQLTEMKGSTANVLVSDINSSGLVARRGPTYY